MATTTRIQPRRPRSGLRRPPLRRRPGRGRARHRHAAALSAALRGDVAQAVRAGHRHRHDSRHRRGPRVHARGGPMAGPGRTQHGRGGVDAGAGAGRGAAAGHPDGERLAVRGSGALPRHRQPGMAGRPRRPRGHGRPRPGTRRRPRRGPLPAQRRPGRRCTPRHHMPSGRHHRITGAGSRHRARLPHRGGLGVVGPRARSSGRCHGRQGHRRRARTPDACAAGRQRDLRLLSQRSRNRPPSGPGDADARLPDVAGGHLSWPTRCWWSPCRFRSPS